MRTLIVGLPGSGKTTFAKILSRKTKVPHYEMDQIFWTLKGEERPGFRRECEKIAEKKDWICEGHFTKTHPYFLDNADKIFWLRTPWFTCFRRVLLRVLKGEAPLSRLQFFLKHSRANHRRFRELLFPFMHRVTTYDSPLYSIDEIRKTS